MRLVNGTGSLIATTVATCFGTNVLAADQFMAVALPGRMYRDAYEEYGLSRLNLSRTLEDSATITSALIPWNTCGAYMAATLGVATLILRALRRIQSTPAHCWRSPTVTSVLPRSR
jgi:NhaC family Na+:H+ antiporter